MRLVAKPFIAEYKKPNKTCLSFTYHHQEIFPCYIYCFANTFNIFFFVCFVFSPVRFMRRIQTIWRSFCPASHSFTVMLVHLVTPAGTISQMPSTPLFYLLHIVAPCELISNISPTYPLCLRRRATVRGPTVGWRFEININSALFPRMVRRGSIMKKS